MQAAKNTIVIQGCVKCEVWTYYYNSLFTETQNLGCPSLDSDQNKSTDNRGVIWRTWLDYSLEEPWCSIDPFNLFTKCDVMVGHGQPSLLSLLSLLSFLFSLCCLPLYVPRLLIYWKCQMINARVESIYWFYS